MKKGIIISVAAVILLIGLFVFSSQYRGYREEHYNTSAAYTTKTTQAPETTTEATTVKPQGVVAESKNGDYKVVVDGETVTVVHGDYKAQMDFWYWGICNEAPQIYVGNYDENGREVAVIRVLNGIYPDATDSTKTVKTHSLFLFRPEKDEKGEKKLGWIVADSNTWKKPFNDAIKCEFTQLKSCEKILQFAMDNKKDKIEYDEKTGITTNKYAGFASVSKNENGKYYTMKAWSKNVGDYTFDEKGNINLSIQILIQYNEYDLVEEIGYINCQMHVRNNKFDIKPNTIKFNASPGHLANDPRKSAKEDWQITITNSSEAPGNTTKTISWVDCNFDVSSLSGNQTQYFSELDSQIKYIDSITFCRDKIVFTAKSGYNFSSSLINSRSFKIVSNEGTDKEIDIGYDCYVEKNGEKNSLVLTFDRGYTQKQLKNISVHFGR